MQRNDIGRRPVHVRARRQRADVGQRLGDVLFLRTLAGVEQGQRAEGGHSALVVIILALVVFRPRSVCPLRRFEIPNTEIQGVANVVGRQIGPVNRYSPGSRYNQKHAGQDGEKQSFHYLPRQGKSVRLARHKYNRFQQLCGQMGGRRMGISVPIGYNSGIPLNYSIKDFRWQLPHQAPLPRPRPWPSPAVWATFSRNSVSIAG